MPFVYPGDAVFQSVCRLFAADGDFKSLALMSRTCVNWQRIAEARLYETIDTQDIDTALGVFTTLATCSRVAAHVREIFIYITLSHSEYDHARFLDVVGDGLASLTAPLRRLTILVYPVPREQYVSWPKCSVVLRSCDVPTTELWIATVCDTDLQQFLNRQGDALHRLTIEAQPRGSTTTPSPFEGPVALDHDAIPRLSVFEAASELAVAFVTSRPVSHCKLRVSVHRERDGWGPSYSTTKRVNAAVSCFNPELRSLHLTAVDLFEELTLDVLRIASYRLPQLRYIGRLQMPMTAKRPDFLHYLGQMRELKFLELTLIQHYTPLHEAAMRHLALLCASYCPTLLTVTFAQAQVPAWRYRFVATEDREDEGIVKWVMHVEDANPDALWSLA